MVQIIEQIEPEIVNDIAKETLSEVIEWIELQDKPDGLQIYIKIKKLMEGEKR